MKKAKSSKHIILLGNTRLIIDATEPISKAAASRCVDRYQSVHHLLPSQLQREIWIDYEVWKDPNF